MRTATVISASAQHANKGRKTKHMTIIEPKVEIIKEENPFKKIEMAGRTCYKSEKAISEDSAIAFYDRLVKSKHTAMLEHATFVFRVELLVYEMARRCPYLHATSELVDSKIGGKVNRFLVSGNLRAINESRIYALIERLRDSGIGDGRLAYIEAEKPFNDVFGKTVKLIDFAEINNPTPAEIAAHKYTTMRFTTDRGVSHELVRHRPFSFAQESTRYVTYTKEQFGGGDIKFIKPAGYDDWSMDMKQHFEGALREAEQYYNRLIMDGASAQQARAVLPNAVKTEIIVTGNDAEWQHFFNLRSKGTTGAPHPDMKIVADLALDLYNHI